MVSGVGTKKTGRFVMYQFSPSEFASEPEKQAYLFFGYIPNRQISNDFFLRHFASNSFTRPGGRNSSQLVADGLETLRTVLREEAGEEERIHVIPLSGGLDSRAILAGLLEFIPRDRIITATFGVPGSWDYDIGRQVAAACGVKNIAVDLSGPEWRWDRKETYSALLSGSPPIWLFEAYVNRSLPEMLGRDKVYWSGFMGDPLAGSKLYKNESCSWSEAQQRFSEKNRFAKKASLCNPSFRAEQVLPAEPFCDFRLLNFDEQLDFMVRQACLIEPLVVPKGFDYRRPFLNPAWVSFSLSIPRDLRRGQLLYKEILKKGFPSAFALPTKTYWGLPLDARPEQILLYKLRNKLEDVLGFRSERSIKDINYVDFSCAIRQKSDLRELVQGQLAYVARLGKVPWIDGAYMWREHLSGVKNYAYELLLLSAIGMYSGGVSAVGAPGRNGRDEYDN